MSDTIELLEAIGRDATLRHARADALVCVLAQAQASEALVAAVAQGDSMLLAAELGHKPLQPPQITQAPAREDDEEPEEDGDDEPQDVPANE